jgi:ornithine cyclodeaminase/alanine dehydrogenase-like protein (mu-crystallin family)
MVRQLVSPGELVEPLAEAFRLYAAGGVLAPDESRVEGLGLGSVFAYLSWAPPAGLLGGKMLAAFDANPEQGLPYISATTLLLDSQSGRAVCILNGAYLTAARTAAAAALATRCLGDPSGHTLGVLGAGLQAETSCEAHLASGRFSEVRIWSRRDSQVAGLIDRLRPRFTDVRFVMCHSPLKAVQSNVVCTTTRATSPLVTAEAFPPGAHLNVIGPLRPGRCEVDPAVLREWPAYTDSRPKLMAMWDASAVPPPSELGEVLLAPPRQREAGQRTVFKPVGMAFEDVVSAQLAFSRAQARNVGSTVPW